MRKILVVSVIMALVCSMHSICFAAELNTPVGDQVSRDYVSVTGLSAILEKSGNVATISISLKEKKN